MNIIDPLDLIGLKDVVKTFVGNIFTEINKRTDALFQTKSLLYDASEQYADYIVGRVGMFPLFGTTKITSVDSSYIRVDVSQDIQHEKYRRPHEIARDLRLQKIGEKGTAEATRPALTPIAAIEQSRNGFALIGNAGFGKTTAFRFLAVQAARGFPIREKSRLPLYLSVRDLGRSGDGIACGVQKLLSRFGIRQPEIAWKLLLKSGACIFLVDGIDETKPEHRSSLIWELAELQSMHKAPVFCVSARPLSLQVELNGFTKWEVIPLRLEDRREFVRKWFFTIDPEKGERLLAPRGAAPTGGAGARARAHPGARLDA